MCFKGYWTAGSVLYTCAFYTSFVETSSKRAVEDNDFVMPWEDTAAGVACGTREEKARNSPWSHKWKANLTHRNQTNKDTVLQV